MCGAHGQTTNKDTEGFKNCGCGPVTHLQPDCSNVIHDNSWVWACKHVCVFEWEREKKVRRSATHMERLNYRDGGVVGVEWRGRQEARSTQYWRHTPAVAQHGKIGKRVEGNKPKNLCGDRSSGRDEYLNGQIFSYEGASIAAAATPALICIRQKEEKKNSKKRHCDALYSAIVFLLRPKQSLL